MEACLSCFRYSSGWVKGVGRWVRDIVGKLDFEDVGSIVGFWRLFRVGCGV